MKLSIDVVEGIRKAVENLRRRIGSRNYNRRDYFFRYYYRESKYGLSIFFILLNFCISQIQGNNSSYFFCNLCKRFISI